MMCKLPISLGRYTKYNFLLISISNSRNLKEYTTIYSFIKNITQKSTKTFNEIINKSAFRISFLSVN